VFGTWEARARRLAEGADSILGAEKEGCEGSGSEGLGGIEDGGWWLVRCDVACVNHDGGSGKAFRNTICS
jgi:hypothetical protein